MKTILNSKLIFITGILLIITVTSCKENNTGILEALAISEAKTAVIDPKTTLSKEFNDYWYAGEAEITSYKLEQARYGEMRGGEAVLVFVTEDFLPEIQVKADHYSEKNMPVLKLNATKNFNTGIYPYSIMQSTFYPVANNQHALKVSASIQEWCGHVYAQLNNRDAFEVTSHSYFQNEADQAFQIEKTWMENELWTKLRINPEDLPVGKLTIIPSIEFTRLGHKSIKAYKALASLKNGSYTLTYPELERSLQISFNTDFPYDILGWEETTISGYGNAKEKLTTKATKLESLKSAYWSKNNNANESLRNVLQLR